MPVRDLLSVIEPSHLTALKNAIMYHPVTGPAAHHALGGLGKIADKGKLLAKKAYKTVTAEYDPLEGGIAEGAPDSDFDPKSIKDGMKVEREHTIHKNVQKRIAKDHLKEDPKYYLKLKKMEHGQKD